MQEQISEHSVPVVEDNDNGNDNDNDDTVSLIDDDMNESEKYQSEVQMTQEELLEQISKLNDARNRINLAIRRLETKLN